MPRPTNSFPGLGFTISGTGKIVWGINGPTVHWLDCDKAVELFGAIVLQILKDAFKDHPVYPVFDSTGMRGIVIFQNAMDLSQLEQFVDNAHFCIGNTLSDGSYTDIINVLTDIDRALSGTGYEPLRLAIALPDGPVR